MLCTSLIQAGLSVFLTLFGLFYFSPKNITLFPEDFFVNILPGCIGMDIEGSVMQTKSVRTRRCRVRGLVV